MAAHHRSRSIALRPLVLAGLVLVAGCSEYRSFGINGGQSWADAQRTAVRDTRTASAVASTDVRHQVRRGETLGGLGQRYEVSAAQIAQANRLHRPYSLAAGQVLVIPGGARPATPPTIELAAAAPPLPTPRPASPPPEAAAPVVVASLEPSLPAAGAPPAPEVADPEATRRAQHERPPALSGDGFAWPLKGKIVSAFGDKPNGQRNDGINIAAKAGVPVLAAENGIVVFADSALSGFGRMLLIRHSGGYTTAYAHLQSYEVAVGDHVRRGQQLGRVGATGDVRTSQLHFEIRSGTKSVEPTELLVEPRNQLASR